MIWHNKFPTDDIYYKDVNGILYNNDVISVLKRLPNESIDCVVTSPPYWGLRDYGVDRQIGLEPTFQEYLKHLWEVFDEIYRILKPMGTLWVNLGDSYSGSGNGAGDKTYEKRGKPQSYGLKYVGQKPGKTNIKSKSLIMIPSRFAIGMIDRGWILRNEIIWHKPNCMPQSVKDRFTVDFEKIFFFVKNRKYYFEQQFDKVKETSLDRAKKFIKNNESYDPNKHKTDSHNYAQTPMEILERGVASTLSGKRNKRTVWSITTKSFKDAHFAVFPPELPKTCIKSGCPKEVCAVCGEPSYIITKSEAEDVKISNNEKYRKVFDFTSSTLRGEYKYLKEYNRCEHGVYNPGIVLDPFMGSGTTAIVAMELGRRWIGIELNKEYCDIVVKRIKDVDGGKMIARGYSYSNNDEWL